jgi:hypothetical protein
MKKVHPEFAYQSRELGGQIEGILGDPPNQKNYDQMVGALIREYASGDGIEDVNMMAFALVDHIEFSDSRGLLREAADYENGDPEKVFSMAACEGEAEAMYQAITENHPELARQAIITAFLYKNPRLWDEEDTSFAQLGEDEDEDEEMEDQMVSDDFSQLFDQEEDQ